jgi:hypothetical protein
MLFLDTETCGFHGPVVLIQYAIDDGPIEMHEVWRSPIIETIKVIEMIVEHTVVGFNLTFDWFHLCKLYTTLVELGERVGYDKEPADYINEYAACEPIARDGSCLKPAGALDLMLHARKGPYQSTMDRRDIRIKRVPKILAPYLIEELDKRVVLKDIYFSRKKDGKRWHTTEIKDNPDFVDISLKFAASAALKVLAVDALGKTEVLRMKDIGVNKKFMPVEVGWAPFALALSNPAKSWRTKLQTKQGKKKGYAWPGVIRHHIDHWAFSQLARQYASDDIVYTRGLYELWKPEPNDNDSILACMVGAVRWRGFSLDLAKIAALKERAIADSKAAPTAPDNVRRYLEQVMQPVELLAMIDQKTNKPSTKKQILQKIAKELKEADCPKCSGKGCGECKEGAVPHPAGLRAKACLDARIAKYKIGMYDKLLIAGRLHASLKVIGTLSSRMAGTDGLNSTGISHEKEIRECFTLSHADQILCGGDFSSFEVSIADARYDDPDLRRQLLTCYWCKNARTVEQFDAIFCPHCGYASDKCKKCRGSLLVKSDGTVEPSTKCNCCTPKGEPEDTLRKIHGLFGMELADEEVTYEDVLATKGKVPDLYDQGKRGVFAKFYGGNYFTLMTRIGIEEEKARKADEGFDNRFQGVGRARAEIAEKFCSMRQPEGIGKRVYWHEPCDKIESLNGHPRYFTLENNICRALYQLAEDPPEEWQKIRITVVRRDREQRIGGAVRSAVFAAAFAIQSQNMRAAANHEIQATGAIETKRLQCRIWEYQPAGIKPWYVQPFQVHDEIWAPCLPRLVEPITDTVHNFVKERKSLIPLLKIDWATNVKNWSEK